MRIWAKEDIKNTYGQIIWHKGKEYEAVEYSNSDFSIYVVKCELIGNEYPSLYLYEILEKFWTIEDIREASINNILK